MMILNVFNIFHVKFDAFPFQVCSNLEATPPIHMLQQISDLFPT
ncbi:hypothetical protein SAMN04488116_3506 [Flagellimonas flava]|uniref:Uncharacterized protein n=1 Tax=Flagellimonas flava TaxID=570519 RepID=A0A1M5Q5E5_9FLAO|nr:hypothetical protein SAMN04488116_3506 [Allomuricauda flava]